MDLLHEYVQELCVELKIDRRFVGRLRRGMGTSFAGRGRTIALQWIRDLELYDGAMPVMTKKIVLDFAASRYPKAFHKAGENEMEAGAEIRRMLDVKFANLGIK